MSMAQTTQILRNDNSVAVDLPVTTTSSDYTVGVGDVTKEIDFDSSSTPVECFLPGVSAVGNGFNVLIRNINSAIVTITPDGPSQTIDGQSSVTLIEDQWRWIRTNGMNWTSIARNDQGGTVTSVATGTGLTGGPITTSGTISIDSTVVTLSGTQTLTNKTLTSPTINTPTLNGSGGQLTLPAGPNTLVARATTDTLTNKTLTSAVIDGTGIPTVGLYSPTTNVLGFASNSTLGMTLDASQRLNISTTGTNNSGNAIEYATINNPNALGLQRYSNDATRVRINFYKSRGATVGTQAVLQTGDVLGELAFLGSDGSAFVPGAVITAFVDGTPGANDMPGRLVLTTTSDGAANATERLRIDCNGQIILGNATGGALATNATGLMPAMPSCAGAATGTPAVSYTGFCPFVYDTTNNRLYVYNQVSAGWKSVVLT